MLNVTRDKVFVTYNKVMGFLDSMLQVVGGVAPLVGSGLQAVTNLVGGSKVADAQREANAQNYKMFKEQLGFTKEMWQKNNEYNSPFAQRERYEEAGINPYFALGNITGGNAESVTTPTPNAAQPVDASGRAIQQVGSDANAYLSQAAPAMQQVLSNREAIKAAQIDNAFRASRYNNDLALQIAKIDKEIADTGVSEETRKNLSAQRDLMVEEYKQLSEYTKYISRRAKADTEKAEFDADLSYASAQYQREQAVYYATLNEFLPSYESAQIKQFGANAAAALAQSKLFDSQKSTEDNLRDDRLRHVAAQALEAAARAAGIKLDNTQKEKVLPYVVEQAKNEAHRVRFGWFEMYGLDPFKYHRAKPSATSRW